MRTRIAGLPLALLSIFPCSMAQTQPYTLGDIPPSFSLPYATQDSVASAGLEVGGPGKSTLTILAFYPADWSGGCTTEMCTMRDSFTELSELGATVYGISGDYVYSHREWAKHLNLQFALLSDHDHAVAKRFGSYNETTGFNKRTVFVIDREGRIVYMDLAYSSRSPDSFDRLRKALGELAGTAQESIALVDSGETRFSALRQLTFGGQNAEAYFSFDEKHLIFQSTRDALTCDQEFIMDLHSGSVRMVSTGTGRTTCGYFLPGDTTILYSSTHHVAPECPPVPDYSRGYVWAVYPGFDIFVSGLDGSALHQLTTTAGYDAEATISPTGESIVFTSMRNGDLDVYSMNLDGSGVRQLTHETGYDGGAFYSWDGKLIVYRGWHHTDSLAKAEYTSLLSQNLVRPSRMELFVMNADGTGRRQVTNNGAANFGPFFHPDNKRIIFASNLADPKGRNFDLYLVNIDGTGLERITFNETFDGFPMFTRDGKRLVFASNRNGRERGETNVFIAEWKD